MDNCRVDRIGKGRAEGVHIAADADAHVEKSDDLYKQPPEDGNVHHDAQIEDQLVKFRKEVMKQQKARRCRVRWYRAE